MQTSFQGESGQCYEEGKIKMWSLILLAAIYIAVNFFLWHRVVRLLKNVHGFFGKKWAVAVFTLIYLFFFNSIWIWAVFDNPSWTAFFKFINNIWIGIFIYALFFVAAAEIITFILWAFKKMRKGYGGYRRYIVIRGTVVIILVISFSLYGVFHYQNIKTAHYSVEMDKSSQAGDSMRVVLVADTHLGYSVGNAMMSDMVDLINRQKPDLVVFAGDIVDNDYYAVPDAEKIAETLSGIESKYGVYGCYGNHDVEETLIGGFTVSLNSDARVQPEVDQFVERAGIKILEDEAVTIAEDITLIGRRDAEKPNSSDGKRASVRELTAAVDKSKPVICIDHQPSQIREKAAAGIDLDLGGHTHDGQIFPGNITINFFWDNPYGILRTDHMYSIVTSGVGVWGPAMRVATDSEIAVIDISFKQ